ncbi:centrosomal protein of 135 kDa isoform X2 [Hermetia illucens]|uniref:centrosomal protein of 135 kDa isoform X2 n=1 Tax=Hermetia illucens TaxID=343691 RepID=UPI0018CC4498|nr:centrosomal protein of 135 kDa isoform X2 [Hermetia illucens]
MSITDSTYDNLREKLDILGYQQTLPLSAVPLVGVIFEDLIKTTESLRNAKLEIAKYLEEKSCWDLGVEPYKCDNSRLLSECNSLHLELVKQKDEFEEKICDYRQKIRNLEADKLHLEEHCAQLEKNVRDLLVKLSGGSKSNKNDVNMSRKPFISTVKSGGYVPNPAEPSNAYRCTKCSSVVWTKHMDGKVQEVQLLQNGLQSQADQITALKEKLERRDREINRLNDLLCGGRPADALAKDCCYKNIGTLSEDVEDLQKEKAELVKKFREAQNSMHEAMQRAITLEEKNKQLENELEDFQKAALSVEYEANAELAKKENELSSLKKELERIKSNQGNGKPLDEKKRLSEQLNFLSQREKELVVELEKTKKKNAKLKSKITSIQQDTTSQDLYISKLAAAEEDVKRYRNERDFFQREYLKIVEKSVPNKEMEMLKMQLASKDEEVKALSKELHTSYQSAMPLPVEDRSSRSHSVQAAIMRAERERDVVKEELRLLKIECDHLRDKLDHATEMQMTERYRIEEENRLLQSKIHKLETEKREVISAHIPERTQLTLVKEELEEMKRRIQDLQSENHKLSTTNHQLRILQDQTEKALIDHQNKLLAAETNLENAECQLQAINTTRESSKNGISTLQREITALKTSNTSLENEKDKIMCELDVKTERVYQLELELKAVMKQKQELQTKVNVLEKKISEMVSQKQEYESELHETSTESKTLREQISNLKLVKDQTLADNCRTINELAEVTAELRQVKQKLKESEKEVEKLKQQLQQYVQEVKRVEELLSLKEQEREEMLEHYRCLSHDAVMLEGNNQSLEIEAADFKQQLCDAQSEIDNLKRELKAKDDCLSKLESQVSLLSSQISESQTELEQNYDELRLTKVDLEASKELIAKLDVQRDKLYAELEESKTIRSQLENEIKELRNRMVNIDPSDRSNLCSIEELLSTTRNELELQRKRTCQLNQDLASLKKTICELEDKLTKERKKCHQNETLAKEYSLKIKELQQVLTNNRFEEDKTRGRSPRRSCITMYTK